MNCVIDLSNFAEGDIKDIELTLKGESDILSAGEFASDVLFQGWIVKQDEEVSLGGQAIYEVNHACDLCGEAFSKKYSTKVSATFRVKQEEDDFPFDGVSVDIALPIRESIILACPSRVVCKESCKGLCPHCGKNLNDGECDCCEKEEKDNPFSLLKNINFTGGASNGSTKE